MGLAACVPQAPQPTPAPAPVARPAPTPAPAPVTPPAADWIDAPQTPGDWLYSQLTATFGEAANAPRFALRCDRARRQVSFVRAGVPQGAGGTVPMRVLTETATRTLSAQGTGAALAETVATVPAGDPLLDAMALSRGRFAVAVAGLPTLYLPSWAEVGRVVEDCR